LTRLFGLSPEQLDARGGIAALVGAPPDAADWTGETAVDTADGRRIDVTVRLSPIEGEGAAPLGRMAMLTDVTEIRQADRQRRDLEQQFFQAQKLEAVGRLAGGIAHDFNNILAAIIGYDTFLIDDLPEGSELRRYAEQIGLAAERAKGLVRRLLAFSRRGEDETTVVDLAHLCDETGEMLRATLPSSIDLVVDVATRPLTVRGNPTQLSQVLMNLGVNARDAIGERHGTIRLCLDTLPAEDAGMAAGLPGTLRLGATPEGAAVARLRLVDDGCGMPPAVLERIFEPFYTTKVMGDGTGLGLAAVHGIVEAHQGALTVETAPGQGTVFDIRLPLALADAAPAPPRSAAPRCGTGATILVVDDEEMVTTMTARLLERSGYAVVATTDPTEALEALLGDPGDFDCVVSDQTMPELTGIELIEALACKGVAVPVVLLSGNLSGVEDKARSVGAAAVLRKPVERHDLIAAIEAALAETRAAAARRADRVGPPAG
jgi:signal transduction histidine kinase/ActR/RegA family two-component response regulator